MINSEETNENLPLLTILVGIQGSGKSTWAGNQDDFDGFLLSSDALRSEYPDWTNDEIFKEIYKRANETLSKGIDVIIDSTAITIKSRRKMLNAINVPCVKKALIFNTPYEECKRRLIQRNREVIMINLNELITTLNEVHIKLTDNSITNENAINCICEAIKNFSENSGVKVGL